MIQERQNAKRMTGLMAARFPVWDRRDWSDFACRLLDILLCGVGLLLLLPVLIVAALAIQHDTPGPVFFIQTRVGRDGREFSLYKFRSMVVNADALVAQLAAQNERTGPVFKMKDDPRITRVGRTLRKYSLDELPQLWNVLRGEMSLVGPRPALPREVAQYGDRERERLAATPGLTGLWQVSGRANLSFEESIDLDLRWVEGRSPWLYLSIVARTIPAVITGHGAY